MNIPLKTKIDRARQRAYREAAEWYMQMQEQALDAKQKTCFDQWLAADVLHQEVWANVIMFDEKLGRVPKTVMAQTMQHMQPKQHYATKFSLILFAICVALYAVQGIRQQDYLPEMFSFDPVDIYKTQIGEQQQLSLADGSQLWLNSDSKIRVKYNTKQRRIELARGEIYIETHKDSQQRPFTVHTADGDLLALGTVFNVRHLPTQTELIVKQGIVRTQPQQSQYYRDVPAQHTIRFDEKQIYIDAYSDLPLLWRQQLLVVHSMPLEQFITELSRYHQNEINLDPSLEKIQVSGAYSTQDLARTLNMLKSTYHLHVIQSGPDRFDLEP
ncbi:MAG: DUF4880 domain-containing protein [Gammaproteobacteria bacterium]|nr:DUF4880 domain-containing protein [Gammaproteobacteria bacterium]